MIGGELLQGTVAQTVQTAVATVDPVILSAVIQESHERSAHATVDGVFLTLGLYSQTHALQPVVHSLTQVALGHVQRQVVKEEAQIGQGVLAGHLATVMSAHAVGNSQEQTVICFSRETGFIDIITQQF